MAFQLGFSVRGSGRFLGKHYIDLNGSYELGEIALSTNLKKEQIEKIMQACNGELDSNLGVYFFSDRDSALSAIHEIENSITGMGPGKSIFLTNEEIDYIRQALINEGSNVISVRNEIKKHIFDKFNK